MTRHTPPRPHRKPKSRHAGPRSAGRLQRAIDEATDRVVRQEIAAALRETGGNVVHAARRLGISQPSMYARMAAVGIDPAKYRR